MVGRTNAIAAGSKKLLYASTSKTIPADSSNQSVALTCTFDPMIIMTTQSANGLWDDLCVYYRSTPSGAWQRVIGSQMGSQVTINDRTILFQHLYNNSTRDAAAYVNAWGFPD